jgi:multicomponent K+:H+ antiporter subunit E
MKEKPWFRLFPMPAHSLLLFVVWLLLNNTLAAGHIVLATFFAVTIPLLTSRLQDPQPSFQRPLLCLKYVLRVISDIIMANFEVALLVLGPTRKLEPGFVAIPIDIEHKFPITILASTVSLTPGTVSAEISSDERWLYVHVLHLADKEALISSVKQRYEAPLKEIFKC